MAAYLSTDATVTVLSRGVVGKKRRTYGSIAWTTTAATYTIATGIPLPALTYFGFMKQIDNMFLTKSLGSGATEMVFIYDKTNHSIRVYRSAGFTPAGSVSAPTIGLPAGTITQPTFTGTAYIQTAAVTTAPVGSVSKPVFTGVALTVAAPAFTGTAVAAAALAEFPNTTAIGAAMTLYFDAIGV